MDKKYSGYIGIALACVTTLCWAHSSATTHRIHQFENSKVAVWETIVYPSKQQILSMHRHERDRVVVALTDGTLKIENDKGKIHYLHLKKDHSYYLSKDVLNELHSDQNVSGHTIKVIVVELK
ncbi:MAG: hypothetical protein KBB94_07580 [Legionellaceae bacterium]|nr:hypothetical protein [Legionellaceae bacterium]MBP9775528.1 hypothetical protein [Legionellaceae bacterium]